MLLVNKNAVVLKIVHCMGKSDINFNSFSPREVCSSPIDVPQIKYGCPDEGSSTVPSWSWADISSPISRCSEKVSCPFLFKLASSCVSRKKRSYFMWYFIGCGISLGAYICVNYGYCYHLMQVRTLLSSLQFSVMKIPVRGVTENLSEGMLWQKI